MKVHSAKHNQVRTSGMKAFTLIEMIGVLAVIAILAAVLIPKVFEAINNSRVNNAAMSVNTVKTAIADHFAKAGSLPVDASGATPAVLGLPVEQYDLVPLVKEQFLDKPFAVKIGDGLTDAAHTRVRAFDITALQLTSVVDATAGSGFNLDGDAGALNDVVGSVCIEAVITGVTAADAKAFNDRIDGSALGTAINQPDLLGRVKYDAPVGGVTTVYVYITHR